MRVLSIGEMLWDIFPDQERLGGAPLNFCANMHRLGDSATLITAVGKDHRGQLACEVMRAIGLTTDFVQVVEHKATGAALVSTSSEGEPHFVIPRPAAFDAIELSPQIFSRVRDLSVDWLYFGTLLQTESEIERFTESLALRLPGARCFYDMNLRAGHWNFPLIQRLSRLSSVLKLNEGEAETLSELGGTPLSEFSLESFCPAWASTYGIDVICVTLGAAGCCVYADGSVQRIPGYPVIVRDTVGSGDAFAAAFLHGYHRGWPILQTARFANALGAIVASHPGATPDWSVDECLAMAASPANAISSPL